MDAKALFSITAFAPINGQQMPRQMMAMSAVPNVRIMSIEWLQDSPQKFTLRISFMAEDLPIEDLEGMRRFRDTILAAISITTMTPVYAKTLGSFTYDLGAGKGHLVSLSRTVQVPETVMLRSMEPIARSQLWLWRDISSLRHWRNTIRFIDSSTWPWLSIF